MCTVTFSPTNITVTAGCGDTLLETALEHGVDLAHACGGNCACTTCHVRVRADSDSISAMEEVERERLSTADRVWQDSRLACQVIVRQGHVSVEIVTDPAQG